MHVFSGIGAQEVVFMDYNKEVLELTTCPNVLKNVGPEAYARASFYAGAWGSVTEYLQNVETQASEDLQYDLILTAETIYTEAVTVELYEVRYQWMFDDEVMLTHDLCTT